MKQRTEKERRCEERKKERKGEKERKRENKKEKKDRKREQKKECAYRNMVILNQFFNFFAFQLEKFFTFDDINKVLVDIIFCCFL